MLGRRNSGQYRRVLRNALEVLPNFTHLLVPEHHDVRTSRGVIRHLSRASIILPDVYIKKVAPEVVMGAMQNSG